MKNLLFTLTKKNSSEFLVEQRVKRNEQRTKRNEQRATSKKFHLRDYLHLVETGDKKFSKFICLYLAHFNFFPNRFIFFQQIRLSFFYRILITMKSPFENKTFFETSIPIKPFKGTLMQI